MHIREFIEMGEKRAGRQVELAKILKVRASTLRGAKSGLKGLPDAVCINLAEYIGVDPIQVISASNLVTEKDEGRREIFERYVQKPNAVVSTLAMVGVIFILSCPPNANAGAAPIVELNNNINYQQLYINKFKNSQI